MLSVPFDTLPDNARVRVPVALAVTGASRSVAYSLAKQGKFPPIARLAHSRHAVVVVGELRAYLNDPEGYVAPVTDEARHAIAA